MEVLGDGLGRDATHLLEGNTTDDGRRAAPERRVVAVLARAHDLEEQALFVPARFVVLHRVLVVEVVRALHERGTGVAEVADGQVERVGQGDVVGVQEEDQLTVGAGERMVDVAGLRVVVVGPRDPLRAPAGREGVHLLAAAVVEEIGRVWVAQRRATGEGRLHDVDRLVIRADEDVDRPSGRGRRRRFLAPVPPCECEEREGQEAIALDQREGRERERVGAAPREPDPVREPRAAPREGRDRDAAEQPRVVLPPTADAGLRCAPRTDVAVARRHGHVRSAGATARRRTRDVVGCLRDGFRRFRAPRQIGVPRVSKPVPVRTAPSRAHLNECGSEGHFDITTSPRNRSVGPNRTATPPRRQGSPAGRRRAAPGGAAMQTCASRSSSPPSRCPSPTRF